MNAEQWLELSVELQRLIERIAEQSHPAPEQRANKFSQRLVNLQAEADAIARSLLPKRKP